MILLIFLAASLLASNCHTHAAPNKSSNQKKGASVRDFSKMAASSSAARAWDDLIKGSTPSVIRVVGDNCSECKSNTPIYKDVAATLTGKVTLVDLDFNEFENLIKQFSIKRLPGFLFASDGRIDVYRPDLNSLNRETLTTAIKKHFRIRD